MKNQTTNFKIRNKNGLYSTGGTHPNFNKNGKVWKKMGDINCHLNLIRQSNISNIYNDCEIVPIIIEQKYDEENKISIKDIIPKIREEKERKRLEDKKQSLLNQQKRIEKEAKFINEQLSNFK